MMWLALGIVVGLALSPWLLIYSVLVRSEIKPMIDKDAHDSLWMLVLFAIACGLAGEVYRADKDGMPWPQLLRRVMLRSLFCSLSAVIVGFLCLSAGWDVYLTLAISGISGLLGADIMVAFFERFLFSRFGVSKDGN